MAIIYRDYIDAILVGGECTIGIKSSTDRGVIERTIEKSLYWPNLG